MMTMSRVEELINRQVAQLSNGVPARSQWLNSATVISLVRAALDSELRMLAHRGAERATVAEARTAAQVIKVSTAWLQYRGGDATAEEVSERVDGMIWEALHLVMLLRSVQPCSSDGRLDGRYGRSA